MKIDTSDYYPWDPSRRRPAEAEKDSVAEPAESAAKDAGAEEVSAEPLASASPALPLDEKLRHECENAPKPQEETPEAPKGTLTTLSHILSWVFSPAVVPTYGILAVFWLSMLSYAPAQAKWLIAAIVFSMTCVIPCAAIFVLTKFGDIHDMALTRRTDRLYPYLITAACLLGCGYYLTRTGLPDWVGFFYIGAAIATGVNLIVNFFWKISAHGAGIGGLIAMLMVLNRYGLPSYNLWGWVVAAVAIGGLLGAARVWLWRHTPLQTVFGEIVGFLGVLFMESFFQP